MGDASLIPQRLASLLEERCSLDRGWRLTIHRREGEESLEWLRALPALLGGGGVSWHSAAGGWRYQLQKKASQRRLLALAAPLASVASRRRLLRPLARRLGTPLPPRDPALAAAERKARERGERRLQRRLARGWRLWGWGSFRLPLRPYPRGRRWRRLQWQWLAGYCDGDGCCTATANQLSLAGHRRELGPLRQARRLLNHGAVQLDPPAEGQGAEYRLSHPRPLRRWLRRCGPHLQNPERRAQAAALAERLGMPLPRRRRPAAAAPPPPGAWASSRPTATYGCDGSPRAVTTFSSAAAPPIGCRWRRWGGSSAEV